MTLTNPLGLSNSGSRPFSNLFGRIAIDNFNILKGSISSYDYYASIKKQPKYASNKYPNLKPRSISEVIKSTGLLK
jgi:hypothetical protein